MCGRRRNDEEGGRGKEMKREGGRKRKDREDGREKKVEGRPAGKREVEEGRKMRQIFHCTCFTYVDKHITNCGQFY